MRWMDDLSLEFSKYFLQIKFVANKIVEFPRSMTSYIIQNNILKKEIEDLRRESDDLKIKIETIKNYEKELGDLKKSLNLNYSISTYKVIERVLGFEYSVFDSFMLISVSHNSIKQGSVVLSSDGIVGIVYLINNDIARVMTITDQKINIPVKSLSGEHIILSGTGKNEMVSSEIKENITSSKLNIKPGDILYTSGEGGVFYSDIPVAKVIKIKESGSILAEPISKINNISFVWIIDPILNK